MRSGVDTYGAALRFITEGEEIEESTEQTGEGVEEAEDWASGDTRLTRAVIGAAIEVHRILGPGFLEKTYQKALSIELTLRGIAHALEVPANLTYKGKALGEGRIDILVEEELVLELKAIEIVSPAHRRKTLTYLKATGHELALIINFNQPRLIDGVYRVAR